MQLQIMIILNSILIHLRAYLAQKPITERAQVKKLNTHKQNTKQGNLRVYHLNNNKQNVTYFTNVHKHERTNRPKQDINSYSL
jgi:hypothetical protein